MATTANQGLRYPALGDAANGPVAVQNLAQDLEPKLVQYFATVAARTTALPAPGPGMLTWCNDIKRLEVWDGAVGWIAIAPIRNTRGGFALGVNLGTPGGGAYTVPWTVASTAGMVVDGVKRVKVTACVRAISSTVLTDLWSLSIINVLSGSVIMSKVFTFAASGGVNYASGTDLMGAETPAASAGQTYNLVITRVNGTGSATVSGPCEILAETLT